MVQFQDKQEIVENEAPEIPTVINIDEDTILEEERRRTGKALATGIVIFLVGLGLYHAAVYGSSRLSALVGGFIIMLLYVGSLLYSSHKKKKLSKSNEAALQREINEVIVKASNSAKKLQEEREPREEEKPNEPEPPDRPRFVRMYSVG